MEADAVKLLKFLENRQQFITPIYQRTYSWTKSQCRQLWEDILRAGSNGGMPAHFVGSIVFIQEELFQHTRPHQLLVIDGQQRLTTVSLIIEALARYVGASEPIEDFSDKKLRSNYLLNLEEQDEHRYKLLLTQTDKETLLSLVDRRKLPSPPSLRVKENFSYFEKWIKELGDNLGSFCEGLRKLMIVAISLKYGEDNPQLIFESMNSTGLGLSQTDLIRNFILMNLKPEHQNRLYNEHWRPMELAFGQEAYGKKSDDFAYYYIILKNHKVHTYAQTYQTFKTHAKNIQADAAGIDAIVIDLHDFAEYYCAIYLGKESDPLLDSAFHDLRELKADVAAPFLLELYHDYRKKRLSAVDLEKAVRLVESYIFRRSVCGLAPNSLNRIFGTFGRELKKDRYLESICEHFLRLTDKSRFPSDKEFRQKIEEKEFYKLSSCPYLLSKLENFNRKERVSVDEYTVEHILPQNSKLSQPWKDALGDDWKQVQEKFLHTLGNLTLTGYNAELGDRPFLEKRDKPGGFKDSPLRLNKGLQKLDTWNKEEIQARAERLSEKAIAVWIAPHLPAKTLNAYHSQTE